MIKYLLDTCTISDYFSGTGATRERLIAHSPVHIAISAITIMEVLYGLQLNHAVKRKLSEPFSSLCATVNIVPFDGAAAATASRIRALMKSRGTPIGSFDLLIAASALAHNCILVTSNVKEFSRIEELEIENWR